MLRYGLFVALGILAVSVTLWIRLNREETSTVSQSRLKSVVKGTIKLEPTSVEEPLIRTPSPIARQRVLLDLKDDEMSLEDDNFFEELDDRLSLGHESDKKSDTMEEESQVFSDNGYFCVPNTIKQVRVTMIGGGGRRRYGRFCCKQKGWRYGKCGKSWNTV